MAHRLLPIILFAMAPVLLPATIAAQRISFGLFAADDLALSTTGNVELNFNQKAGIIVAGNQAVPIFKTDEESVIFVIEGRVDLDVTVSIFYEPDLMLQVGETIHKIPLTIRFAYHNVGLEVFEALPETTIREQALEVPAGFNHATFAMRRRLTGPPSPPPTPDHQGHTQPRGKSYLVIYGTMGPVPINAPAGLYGATVTISVEYAHYD